MQEEVWDILKLEHHIMQGKLNLISPEVWKDQPYDSKSDIWSLGCVLYEMITLRPPFRAENMEGLYNKVIKGQFSKIPEKFSNDLVELVKYLLQVQPDNRPSPGKLKIIKIKS